MKVWTVTVHLFTFFLHRCSSVTSSALSCCPKHLATFDSEGVLIIYEKLSYWKSPMFGDTGAEEVQCIHGTERGQKQNEQEEQDERIDAFLASVRPVRICSSSPPLETRQQALLKLIKL